MALVPGGPSGKLAWLRRQSAAGRLDGDDPDELSQAEALLTMLVRIGKPKEEEEKRHLDELLDEGLKQTFPASDPVAVGHFTSTVAPNRPVDRTVVVDSTSRLRSRRRRPQVRRYG